MSAAMRLEWWFALPACNIHLLAFDPGRIGQSSLSAVEVRAGWGLIM
jgi:hypothetical protein